MKIFAEHPKDGGSYLQNADGSVTQLEATTADRPCKCRPDEHVEDVPANEAVAADADSNESPNKAQKPRRN